MTEVTYLTRAAFDAARAAGQGDFDGVEFVYDGQDWQRVNLSSCTFTRSLFYNLDMRYSRMTGMTARGCRFQHCLLDHSDMRDADFAFASLGYSSFDHVDLRGACFDHANLHSATFEYADFGAVSWLDAELPSDSHDVVASVLYQAACGDVEKMKVAGFVWYGRQYCWRRMVQYLLREPREEIRAWTLATLRSVKSWRPILEAYGIADDISQRSEDSDGYYD